MRKLTKFQILSMHEELIAETGEWILKHEI